MDQECRGGKQWNIYREVGKNNVLGRKRKTAGERNHFSDNDVLFQSDKVVDRAGQIWGEISS